MKDFLKIEKHFVPLAIFLIILPIFVELSFKLLLNFNINSDFILSIIEFIQEVFPTKEIFWTAYTGIFTALGIILAYQGAYILPLRREEQEEYKLSQNLLASLTGEIIANWNSLISENS